MLKKEEETMFFSEHFHVNKQKIDSYGAIDINLVCDLPLFIDPMLIFNSSKKEYKDLHKQIIKYFHFLAKKSENGFNAGEITTFFNFNEIKNNWFGYSKTGNEGNGNGKDFSRIFANNIKFSLNTHSISKGTHFEKTLLLFEGNGRDKLSDLTTHLILDFIATYTQDFALANIDKTFIKSFYLDSRFNYKTETFESIEYQLPYIKNSKGIDEFVLLTPRDILRKNEPTINRVDLINNYDRVRNSISDVAIRSQLENYIRKAVSEYEQECKSKKKNVKQSKLNKIEREAFIEALKDIPELYDYYILIKEQEKDLVNSEAEKEILEQTVKFYSASKVLVELYKKYAPSRDFALSARNEAKQRLIWFKHIIEECDGYKNLYYNGQKISKEDDLQRLFRFVWYDSKFDVNYENNNGRGELDVKVSYGSKEKNIVEFKLASNPNLSHLFDQVKIYEQANQCSNSLYAIFYFSQGELEIVEKMLSKTNTKNLLGESVFLIDCRNDNKPSASTV